MLSRAEREAFERAVRSAFKDAMASEADRLLASLGNPPDVQNIPAALWNRLTARLRAALEPLMVRMAVESATGLVDESGLSRVTNWTLVNGRAADWARRYTFDLVRGINDTTRDMLQREISSFFKDANVDLKTLAGRIAPGIPQLRDRLGRVLTSQNRAAMIAATEVTRAAAEGEGVLVDQIRALNPDVDIEGVWLTANDERVCVKICVPLNGVKDDGRGNFVHPVTGQIYRLPAHPYCLPGDTPVAAIGGITAASKRWYEGDVVIVRTASGKQLTCTPNHPVLTTGGWLAASLLDESSYVISRRGRQWGTFVDDDCQDVPASIQDVAEALGRTRGVTAAEVPLAAPDFHGDGLGSKVAVVWADSLLGDGFDAALTEHLGQLAFGRRDVKPLSLDRGGAFDLFAQGLGSAGGSHVGGSDLRAAFGRRHLSPLERLSLVSATGRDAGFEQVAADDAALNLEGIGQRFLGLAGLVAAGNHASRQDVPRLGFGRLGFSDDDPGFFQTGIDDAGRDAQLARQIIAGSAGPVFADQVVRVERDSFHGFVFNLETESGAYVAAGIITHNCRCGRGTLIVGLSQAVAL